MTRSLIPVLLALITASVSGQKVMRLADARDIGLTTEHMDSLYKSAFNMQDSTDCAFPGRVEEFLEIWPGTLQTMGEHLHDDGFRHPLDIPVTYRIFFGMDGRIEHVHYAMREAIDPELEKRFQLGVEKFANAYTFPLTPDGPFRQCGKFVLQADPE